MSVLGELPFAERSGVATARTAKTDVMRISASFMLMTPVNPRMHARDLITIRIRVEVNHSSSQDKTL